MAEKPKIRLAITGATGSVGGAVLDICARFPEIFEITALSAQNNEKKLAELGRKFGAKMLCLTAPEQQHWREAGFICVFGKEGLRQMAEADFVDHIVFASSGVTAIEALQHALKRGIDVSLANKESIVVAGPWVMPLVQRRDQLRPIDSEHSAVWQCMRDTAHEELARIWLTASGGPFRDYTSEQLKTVTPQAALDHPVWKMGAKITIDSATLMNKGIECIEAMQLFGLEAERVSALVHPRSQVHGMAEFIDGTVRLLLSRADMRLPSAAAIAWPKRLPLIDNGFEPIAPADWDLSFKEIDDARFPCFALAKEAGKAGGAAPALLVGADESAVRHFLSGEIKFTDIPRLIARVLEVYGGAAPGSLEEAVWLASEGERIAEELIKSGGTNL